MTVQFDEDFWNERYRSSHRVWSGNPNGGLVNEVSDLDPGTALDVGCGEGADAIWLAGRGWQVKALDLSIVAVERAAEHVASSGDDIAGRITWQQADLLEWDPGTDRYDLVTSQYVHLPSGPREALYDRLADFVAPGGTLLIVGHHPSDLDTHLQRPRHADLYFTPEDVVSRLDPKEWKIVTAAATSRTVEHDGHEVTIHDSVVRAQRLR
ncbi:class I SAM-dependent methyltransferase [Rhodococcus sp. W8901]|uniref:class I SAM-dependent methyltransferase n=1 Tax=Rhodococcus sp. W8901 TaxID=2742603 RepID=UPI001582C031|nr:class I SAM-dependent methyltransferase [Rhodococcus sp. W8901]QKT10114.1 methyltransferase domain-containing protein [Rhodococcus sp. W8901]